MLTVGEMRDLAMQSAGFDPQAVGAFVKQGIDKLIQKLEATKTQYFSHEGIVIDQREVEDNAAQIKAASELIQIGSDVMALKRRVTDDNGGNQKPITIDLSGWTVTTTKPIEDPSK